jgi:hypothetical protein
MVLIFQKQISNKTQIHEPHNVVIRQERLKFLAKERRQMMTRLEEAIKDRLETGFKNWNGGYESWLAWCNTLYDDASIYNVYGHRLTLKQYQDLMGDMFKKQDIKLGKFHNMIISGSWAAIRYDVEVTEVATGIAVVLPSSCLFACSCHGSYRSKKIEALGAMLQA